MNFNNRNICKLGPLLLWIRPCTFTKSVVNDWNELILEMICCSINKYECRITFFIFAYSIVTTM